MLSLNHSTDYPWVVLVEDDESLRGQLAAALERALPRVEVQRTPDADVALQLVRDSRSLLLITEAQTASVDGLALAACARRQRPQLPLIFLADARARAASAHAARLGGTHLVDKPPQLDRFVDLVARVLAPPVGFRGELSTVGVLELVQLAAMVAPSGALQLSGPDGAGTIWFENGSVVHATLAHERGNAAFQRMLGWRSGQFSIDAAARAPERSVTGNTMALLLDAARLLDEGIQAHVGARELAVEARADARELPADARELSADARELPADARELPADARVADAGRLTRESHVAIRSVRQPEASEQRATGADRAADHFESGLQAVWHKKYADALPQWERAAALEPENRLYQHNLLRLRNLINLDRESGLREVSR
jgi:CheY-like chemotaxis protein